MGNRVSKRSRRPSVPQALYEAAERGDRKLSRQLLEQWQDMHKHKKKRRNKSKDRKGVTKTDVMSALLETRHGDNDWTPLMVACRRGHQSVVTVLLEHSASVNASSRSGKTPLMLAAFEGHSSIAKALIKAGAELDVQDETGQTALIRATSAGNAYIAETLIRARANVNLRDSHDGMNALQWAAQTGPSSVVELLIKWGAEVNVTNHNGQTALICAASKDLTYAEPRSIDDTILVGTCLRVPYRAGS